MVERRGGSATAEASRCSGVDAVDAVNYVVYFGWVVAASVPVVEGSVTCVRAVLCGVGVRLRF